MRGNRPWSQLYRFLRRLPRHGHFYASVMDDEKSIKELLAVTKPDDKPAFGYAGWTYERELLTTICDLLQQFHASFIQANSDNGTRPTVEPMPRPITTLDRLKARKVVEDHYNLVEMMRPRPS